MSPRILHRIFGSDALSKCTAILNRVILNHLPNRGHPERSEGSFATGTESKDPVDFIFDVPLQFHGILRLRYARLSASAPLPMNLPEFAQAGRPFAVTAETAVFRRSARPPGKTARPGCQGRRASRLSHRFIPNQLSRPRDALLRMAPGLKGSSGSKNHARVLRDPG